MSMDPFDPNPLKPGRMSLQEMPAEVLKELLSAIRATQMEHAVLLQDLQARAEDFVVDVEGECFPTLTNVFGYVNSNAIAEHVLKMAKMLLQNLKQFLTTLLTLEKTNLSKHPCWEIVQAIIQILFDIISKARRSCYEITIFKAKTPSQAPELLWAVLEAHLFQNKFLAQNFKSYPAVAPLLTHYLLAVVAFHDNMMVLVKDVSHALANSQLAKCKTDALENQVKTLQAKAPSKNKKANPEASGKADNKK